MNVKIEQADGLYKYVTITVPAEEVNKAFEKKLKAVSKKAKISGFRPGKVPTNVVEKQYGESILHEVAGPIMDEHYRKALMDEKLPVAGPPTLESQELKRKEPFTFKVKVECFPEFKLKKLNRQKFDKQTAEVTEKDIEEMLDTMRKQHKVFAAVERAAKDGDKVDMDFEGFMDGEAFAGGKAEHFALELGSNSMIPGFEDGVLGMKAGDEKTIKVNFPAEYHAKELAGKEAEFKVKVHKVEEAQLPELTDEFATEKMGIKEGGLTELRNQARKNMERELKTRLKNNMKEAALKKLVEINDLPLPEAAVDQEIKAMQQMTRQRMAQQFGGQAAELEKMELPRDLYEKEARQRVAISLLLSEFIKQEELKADEDRVAAQIEEYAQAYDNPEEVVKSYKENENIMRNIESMVLEDMAVEKLLEDAKVKEVQVSYQDVIKKQSEQEV